MSSLTKISVRSDTISYVGDDLHALAGHMTEIDLQDNLLSRWMEIAVIGKEVPSLVSLLLQGNRMEPVSSTIVEEFPKGCFSGLRILALNACHIQSWQQIQYLENTLPNIEELYLAYNRFADLPRDSDEQAYQDATGDIRETAPSVYGFANLRILDLSSCQLEEWSQVQAFGSLPKLQEIVLDGNALTRVEQHMEGTFEQLMRISLSSTGY